MPQRFKHILFLVFLLLLTSSGVLLNNPLLLKIKHQFESYIQHNPQEKIYLHIDKTQTTLGETIWFKVYLVDAWSHLENAASNLVYLDLIDPKNRILDSKHINAGREMAIGDFLIPIDSMPGNYTIRAYTNYMRNFDETYFYHQQIQVWSPYDISEDTVLEDSLIIVGENKPGDNPGIHSVALQVQFFPEGGDLINGLTSKVAFKITGSNGKSREAKAIIFNQDGKFITQAASISQGMGFFVLRPEQGQSYHAEFNEEGEIIKFPLPDALQEGYLLKVNHKSGRPPSISMQTNIKDGLNGAFIIGQMKGQICFTIEGKPNAMELEGQLPTLELPDGICQFTLFDAKGEPVCERLIFIQNPQNQINIDIQTNKFIYGPRDEVKGELEINDFELEEVAANISCSVIDLAAVGGDESGNNIQSYLLLSSDLHGPIEHPAFFLDSMDTRHRLMLDLLMMTQGWRRFVWKKLPDAEVEAKWQYMPERGFTIAGYTTRIENREKPIVSQVFLSTISSDGFHMEDQVTAPDGTFHYGDLNFTDTTTIILQANIFNQKKADKKLMKESMEGSEHIGPKGNRYVSIYRNEEIPPKNNLFYQEPMFIATPTYEYLEDRRMVNRIDSSYRDDWQINLKEIVVKGKKPIKPKEDPFKSFYGTPSDRIILDSLPGLAGYLTVFDLLRGRVPGVQVYSSGFEQYAVIRGGSLINR